MIFTRYLHVCDDFLRAVAGSGQEIARFKVPFAVDPPEWYVFNSRFGGRGARAGAGTSFGRVVVPRVYRVFAGLLTP